MRVLEYFGWRMNHSLGLAGFQVGSRIFWGSVNFSASALTAAATTPSFDILFGALMTVFGDVSFWFSSQSSGRLFRNRFVFLTRVNFYNLQQQDCSRAGQFFFLPPGLEGQY